MGRIFFTLNNHDQKDENFVAYYAKPGSAHAQEGMSYVSDVGATLTISASERQLKSYQDLRKGDILVVYQRVAKESRVVTHVVEVKEPGLQPKSSTRWGYFLKTRVLARLKPGVIAGRTPQYELSANGNWDMKVIRCPENSVRTYHLGLLQEKFAQNGNAMRTLANRSMRKELIRNRITSDLYEIIECWDDIVDKMVD